ncbi:MAG: hypothetical protein RSB14_05645 [Kiritimatiellia bacterium]
MIQEKRISPELSHRIANMSFVCAIFVVLIHCQVGMFHRVA